MAEATNEKTKPVQGTKPVGGPPKSSRLFDIQVSLNHVIYFLVVVVIHEAGVVWWGATITNQINEIKSQMVNAEDVRAIIARDTPWVYEKTGVRESIVNNTKSTKELESRVRAVENLTTSINTKVDAILHRISDGP